MIAILPKPAISVQILRTPDLLLRVIRSLEVAAREHATTRGPDWSGDLCSAALELLGECVVGRIFVVDFLSMFAFGLIAVDSPTVGPGNMDGAMLLLFETRLVLLSSSIRRPYSNKLVQVAKSVADAASALSSH